MVYPPARLNAWIIASILCAPLASAQLTFDFIGDYVAPSRETIPSRAIYRRGSNIILDVRWAPAADDTNALMVETLGPAVLRAANGVLEIPPFSLDPSTVPASKGRVLHKQVVFGPLPNVITHGRLTLPVRITVGGDVLQSKVETNLYTVESRPLIAPVLEGTDFLDEASRYAEGSAGESAARAITIGLNASGRLRYDDARPIDLIDYSKGTIHLEALKAATPLPVNCYQASGYLAYLLAALGIESSAREIVLQPGPRGPYYFETKPAAEVGTDLYKVLRMYSHQFLLVQGRVYDVTYSALNSLDGKPSKQAIAGWTLEEYLKGGFVASESKFNFGYGDAPLFARPQ